MTLGIVGLIWTVSFFVMVIMVIADCFMYPICPSCQHDLYSRRRPFFSSDALCKKHGTFIVAIAYRYLRDNPSNIKNAPLN